MTRVYRIKQISTGQFFNDIEYRSPTKGEEPDGRKRSKKAYRLNYSERPRYNDSVTLNWTIERVMNSGFSSSLDDMEIEAFDIPEPLPYVPVKGTLKMPTIKKRIEAKHIIRKLKAG